MKYITAMILLASASFTHAELVNSIHTISEVQVRSGDYYSATWNNGTTLLVSPNITVTGCDTYRAFFKTDVDKAMLSVALSAHAQGKAVSLLINSDRLVDGICKIELISIK